MMRLQENLPRLQQNRATEEASGNNGRRCLLAAICTNTRKRDEVRYIKMMTLSWFVKEEQIAHHGVASPTANGIS
jgi:hypothetical protein